MPITIDYSGKLVLITGGGRSIGLGIAKALAKAGADVAITYTSRDCSDVASQLSTEHGVTVKAFECEVSDSKSVDKAVAEVEKAFGRPVDIGIANAGTALWKSAENMTDDDLQRIFAVNTFGGFYLSRALAKSWIAAKATRGKQILFISSISAIVAMTPQKQTAYNASKGAVTMMAKSLAAEWAELGITVNAISPGYVSTDMIANPPDETARQWVNEWTKRTPVGRFATADEIGEFVATLVSDKQGGMGWMTGSDIVVDGGYTLLAFLAHQYLLASNAPRSQPTAESSSHSHRLEAWAYLQSYGCRASGDHSDVYAAQALFETITIPVVVKFCVPGYTQDYRNKKLDKAAQLAFLQREAATYERLASVQGDVVPRYYRFWRATCRRHGSDRTHDAYLLILEDVGARLEQLDFPLPTRIIKLIKSAYDKINPFVAHGHAMLNSRNVLTGLPRTDDDLDTPWDDPESVTKVWLIHSGAYVLQGEDGFDEAVRQDQNVVAAWLGKR